MTTLEKAARQALEALKSSRVFVTTREKIKHPEGTEAYDEIIASLRQALENHESAYQRGYLDGMAKPCIDCADRKLQAMKQPKQEPVAWCRSDTVADWKGQILNVAYIFPSPKGLKNPIPLYTEPPQRQPLTDDEIFCLYRTVWSPDENANEVLAFARAIEAKLKEKNA